jgi:DNA-directed RNA polymerase subunit alpha
LPGTAVTAVEIEGVPHEYSTVDGVVEDVVQLVLNLKQIRFTSTAERPHVCRIERSGVGEVTAADIQCPADIEVTNPDQHIANIDEGGSLALNLTVETDHGFRVATFEKEDHRVIGAIPVDAIFSPVRRANFSVEQTRVGQQTDFDRLVLDVWTDSTITPKEALTEAARILMKHLELFCDFDETYVEEIEEESPEERQLRALLDKPVAELELPVRAANCMETAGIRTVRDLVGKGEREMLALKNFGRKSLNEVKEILKGLDLDFGTTFDN